MSTTQPVCNAARAAQALRLDRATITFLFCCISHISCLKFLKSRYGVKFPHYSRSALFLVSDKYIPGFFSGGAFSMARCWNNSIHYFTVAKSLFYQKLVLQNLIKNWLGKCIHIVLSWINIIFCIIIDFQQYIKQVWLSCDTPGF